MMRDVVPQRTLAALAALALVAFVPHAAAVATGPCQIIINGVDVATEGAKVQADPEGNLTYFITAPQPVTYLKVVAKYGPFTIPAFEQGFGDGATTRTGVASAKALGKYGSGLYQVKAEATLADGTSCAAQMDVDVPGSVLASPLGLAAVGLVGAGAVGFLAMLVSLALQVNDLRSNIQDFVTNLRSARDQAHHREAEGAKTPDTAAHGDGPDSGPEAFKGPPGPPQGP